MENLPLQYKFENFIIFICNDLKIINNKINDYLKNRFENITLIRYLKPNNEKYIIEENNFNFYQEYFDELNEEEFIKKTKYIINLENEDIKESIEILINKYNIKVYEYKEWDDIKFEEMLNESFEINNEKRKKIKEDRKNENYENKEINNNNLNKFSIQKEIETNIIKKIDKNDKINLITYVRKIDNEIIYNMQFKCILENYKNKNVQNILVMGNDVETYFSKIHFEKIENKKIILVNDDDDNITFKDLFVLSNELFSNKLVMLIRSDIILLNNPDWENLHLEFYLDTKKMYCLTRIERDYNGRFIRIPPNQNLFGGVEQDGWIFKTPIDIHRNVNKGSIENHDFYEKFSELFMNKYMIENNYELINNVHNYKIIRITPHQDLRIRDYIKPPKQPIHKEDFYFLPEKTMIDNLTIEQWFDFCQVDEEEKYKWKVEIMNRSLKNKINII